MAYAFNDDKSKFNLEETIDNVDSLIGNMAAIETSPVITNHSTGEYIMYNGTLLKVLSPIATGEDLVLGTNVSPVNIGDQLKAFRDSMSIMNITPSSWTPSSGVTVKTLTVYRLLNIVYLTFYFSLSTAKNNNDVILTANSNFPASINYDAQAMAYDVTGLKGSLAIRRYEKKNSIICTGPLSTGNYILAQFCYLTDE